MDFKPVMRGLKNTTPEQNASIVFYAVSIFPQKIISEGRESLAVYPAHTYRNTTARLSENYRL